jgi:serine protease Do
MTDPNHTSKGVFQTEGGAQSTRAAPRRAGLLNRQATLALSTILGLGLLVPLAGTAVVSTVQQARAAEAVVPDTFVAPTGFEDLVEAVMPAVVAVRVMEAPAAGRNLQPRSSTALPDGTPLRPVLPSFRPRSRRVLPSWSGRWTGRQYAERRGGGRGLRLLSFLKTAIWSPTTTWLMAPARFMILMDNGTELSAQVIGTDSRTDLALLKVEGEGFTYVRLADAQPRIGEWVVAIGNPFGLGGTVTAGIVSQQGRDIQPGPFDEFIQIDAAINRGNSGGPTFNARGEVIGVNTAIFSPSGGNVGIAFAVPSTIVQDVVTDLLESGTVARGWLGVNIQSLTPDLAEGIGRQSTDGAIIVSAAAGSPAEEAGLRSGDTILSVNDTLVEGPTELARIIGAFDPNETVEILVWRDGRERVIDVRLGTLPSERELASQFRQPDLDRSQPSIVDQLGMTVAPAASLGLDVDGLAVTDLDPGGVAAERDLREGDVIVEIAGQPVNSVRDLTSGLRLAGRNGQASALVRVQGENGASRFVALPTDRG